MLTRSQLLSVILGLALPACDGTPAASGGDAGGGSGGSATGDSGGSTSEGTGGTGGTATGSQSGCPAELPSFYDEASCQEKGLVCSYVREDGCPLVVTCDMKGGSGWSFYDNPESGSACETAGQSCFYSSPDCGGQEKTAVCDASLQWQVSSEPDGCI